MGDIYLFLRSRVKIFRNLVEMINSAKSMLGLCKLQGLCLRGRPCMSYEALTYFEVAGVICRLVAIFSSAKIMEGLCNEGPFMPLGKNLFLSQKGSNDILTE